MRPRSAEELMSLGLPKWPQHYVTGVPVTVDQAKEIIRRTDTFFTCGYDGNNRAFNAKVRKAVGMPPDSFDDPRLKWPKDDAPEAEKEAAVVAREEAWTERRQLTAAFEKRWRTLYTEYVHNSWVSTAFIGGPHGWCHPDGQIGFIDNVGKWPSVQAVFNDWAVLAETFPFIEVGVTLFDREECEDGKQPVVSMRVKDSKVVLVDPAVENVHRGHPLAVRRGGSTGSISELRASFFLNPYREQGLPPEWLVEWVVKYGPEAP